MNNSDLNNTVSQYFSHHIDLISNFIGFYGIRIICSLGFLINIFIIILLRNKKLKYSFYKHIRVKTVISLFICLIGFGYQNSICEICQIYFRYETIVYTWTIRIGTRIMFMISSFHEIYLITNRYLILKNRNHWIVNINLKYYLPILIIMPTLFIAPLILIISINRSKENSEDYYFSFTNITQTNYFRAYIISSIFIETIFPLVFLIVTSILCHKQYKRRIKIKSKLTIVSIQNLKTLENNYTRIAIILTILFIITRFSDFLFSLVARAQYIIYPNVDSDKIMNSVIFLMRQISYLFYFGLDSFSGLIFLQIDTNLKTLSKRYFSTIKVILFILFFKY